MDGNTGGISGGIRLDVGRPIADVEDEGVEIHLRGIDEEDLYFTGADGVEHAVTMTVAGSYSNRYRRAEAAATTRRIKRARGRLTGGQLVKDQDQVLSSCVISWGGFFSGSEPIPCHKQNVVKVFQLFPHIRQQVQVAIEDHESFFESSSQS